MPLKTVTKTHLRRAIHERNKANGALYDYAGTCLIAQAAKEVYGTDADVATAYVTIAKKRLPLSKKIQNLIYLFDFSDYWTLNAKSNRAKLNRILPTTVRFPKAV